ncbi:nitrate- and nitrite sensing domain-containing protein [Streptomyces sp. NPDC059080]|uniref:sensor histidine kinase n=1 Tax=Streptomyces sp. NPDC059080 TaxID=3346718 RepID=UPI003682C2AC
MRRSKASPEPREARRGNFTPPSRSTGPAPGSPGTTPAPPVSGGKPYSPRNWRVATRLNAILLIPVLLALVFGGLRVSSSLGTWRDAQDAESTAKLVRAALTYGNALIDERDRTAEPLLNGKKHDPAVGDARAATDRAAADFHTAAESMPDKPGLARRLTAFTTAEKGLGTLRDSAYTSALPGVRTEEGYVALQHPLMEFANELGLGTSNITSYGRTVYALSLAKAAASLERSIGVHLLVDPASGATYKRQLTAFASYRYLENIAIGEYTSGGTPEDVERLKKDTAALKATAKAKNAQARRQAETAGRPFRAPPSMDAMATAIGSGASPQDLADRGITPEVWFTAATGGFDMYRSIEKDLADKAVAEAAQISADAKRTTITDAAVVLTALIAAFLVAGLMARRMSRNMRTLRTAAFGIAEQKLPMLVDQLSRAEPGRVDTRVQPIPIGTTDEIGEVARAFDQVHREAVRLASEQAMLRGNVNAIFTNLSRRNQGLIERQLTLITDLENNEADPDQLENLFRMDHLATRMRRNGENLLILAGEEPGRRWDHPVPLVDVLRAATSEVESYERIELAGVTENEIHGQAVTDLVHLLSELLENATTFSSPQTKVRVAATRMSDGRIMVEIHDKGIGLTAEDFADINHKLANPPSVDVAVSQRMGLFVVGRLADRHGIRVQLRPSGEQAGTTSLVMLPDAITHGGGGSGRFEEDFTVPRTAPDQPRAPRPDAPATAPGAAPGDPGVAADAAGAGHDGMSRSLLREERRAALEEAQGAQQADGRPLLGGAAPDLAGYGAQPGPQAYAEDDQPQYGNGTFGAEGFRPAADPHAADQHPYAAPEAPATGGGFEPAAYDGHFGAEAESDRNTPAAPVDASERVPFDRPGPSPSDSHSLTDVGLPRRGGHTEQAQPVQQEWAQPGESTVPPQRWEASEQVLDGSEWRSSNDERWERAERLREPKAGGVTPSGLPRRVPKANLVEGSAEQSPQGGPQVSRAPEDIRGRLSNLRRGVQQGRSARVDRSESPHNDQQGFGPGSTYDQER